MGLRGQHHFGLLVTSHHHHVPVSVVRAGDNRDHRLHELELFDCRGDDPVPWYILGLAGTASLHQGKQLGSRRQCCRY